MGAAAQFQAAPLADRVVDDARVLAHHPALGVQDGSGPGILGAKEGVVAVALDEVLALGLVQQVRPAQLRGDLAHLVLVPLAQREDQMGQLFLGQVRQEVRLVLSGSVPRINRYRPRSAA